MMTSRLKKAHGWQPRGKESAFDGDMDQMTADHRGSRLRSTESRSIACRGLPTC